MRAGRPRITFAAMATTTPSELPLRELLEHRRLAHRDRHLKHVIGVLRSRADFHDPVPRSLLRAIADFSHEHSSVGRRLREIEDAAATLPAEDQAAA